MRHAPDQWMQINRDGDLTAIRFLVPGIVDEPMIRALSQELIALVNRAEKPRFLVDFHSVKFVGSALLATLVEFHRRVLARGGRLALYGIDSELRRVLELTRLTGVLKIYPDEPTARAALAAANPS